MKEPEPQLLPEDLYEHALEVWKAMLEKAEQSQKGDANGERTVRVKGKGKRYRSRSSLRVRAAQLAEPTEFPGDNDETATVPAGYWVLVTDSDDVIVMPPETFTLLFELERRGRPPKKKPFDV